MTWRRRLGLWLLRRSVKFVVRVLRLNAFDVVAELCSELSAGEGRAWGDRAPRCPAS